jgi:putative flippase GtrA
VKALDRSRVRAAEAKALCVSFGGELLRFALVGALSYSLGVGLSAAFHGALGLGEPLAVGLALAIVLCTNFLLARTFVFRSRGPAHRELARFVATSVAARGGEYLLFLALLQALEINYLVALTAAMAVSNVLKFALYRSIVFRRSPSVPRADVTTAAAAAPASRPPCSTAAGPARAAGE